MILTRVIGFREQMPGSGQWRQLTDAADRCWHCDQWIYSLVFWDADTIGRRARKAFHHKVLNQMVKKVEQLNPEREAHASCVSLSVYDEDASDSVATDSPTESPREEVFQIPRASPRA